ncbi:hypothetical protein BKA64DRAFT_689682 [Cadophora sp. MPI-SDFR-AT-0126]|nr:hypothetical protein BKA64DRAFT_689682 [Leotiomycetes sp. MPI-SDFR-AT-0126]
MNARSLDKAFRCCECAVRIAGRGVSVQQRTFSSSSIRQKHGAVPTFTEVSSPELQDLFTTLRERVFLPAHVPQIQRDLIFKGKHKKALEVEPVTAVVGGEEFTLKHLDLLTDIPGKYKSFNKALSLMKDKRDWNNLPNLLQGLKTAKFRLNDNARINLLRKAGKAGRQDVILECLRRADETGLTLTEPNFVVQVFFWIRQKAYLSDWDAEETKKALHWAEMVKDMMAEPKHHPAAGSKALTNLYEVNGDLLELAAVRANKHQDGKDVDGKVERYASDLLASPRDFEARHQSKVQELNFWLSTNVPAVHGLRLAQAVLGASSELSVGLKKFGEELEPLLSKAKEQVSEIPNKNGTVPTGVSMYEKLLGPESS